MPGFDKISEDEMSDAAFFAGLLTANARLGLVPLPVKVDGLATIAFCVRANPPGHPDLRILHPIALVPHHKMLVQDIRNGVSAPLSRATVMPMDVRHAKIYRAAMGDPEGFFGEYWNT